MSNTRARPGQEMGDTVVTMIIRQASRGNRHTSGLFATYLNEGGGGDAVEHLEVTGDCCSVLESVNAGARVSP